MGKQIEFYMTSADEAAFLEFARGACLLQFVRNSHARDEEKLFDQLPEAGSPAVNLVYLTCAGFQVSFDAAPGERQIVNAARSEVVEFSRSAGDPSADWIRHGRLWYEAPASKSETFVKWAGRLFSYIRRHFRKTSEGRYAGPDAWAKAQDGSLKLGRPVTALSVAEAKRKLGLE